jgi:conjugative transfer region protein TrbK
MVAGVAVMVLVVAACAIKLRDDEDQTSSASPASEGSDPLAAEFARCRTVTPEQKDALAECRRIWSEQRRQFLGQKKTPTTAQPNDGAPSMQSSTAGPRKDDSRLPQDRPSIFPSKSE